MVTTVGGITFTQTSGTAISDETWRVWNSVLTTTATSGTYIPATYTVSATADHTWRLWNRAADILVDEATEREMEEAERHVGERHQAWRDAEVLLLEWLNEEQTESYRDLKMFTVKGSGGGVYQIYCDRGIAGNIYRLDSEGRHSYSYCCHPSGVPQPDAWLAQKLFLETDESGFLGTANASSIDDYSRRRLIAA